MPIASRALDNAVNEGLFEAEFARDALIMSYLTETITSDLTRLTLRRLAEVQGLRDVGTADGPSDQEEIGRIPHEIRDPMDPIARQYSERFGWTWPYFGSVDATPMFVAAVGRIASVDPTFLDIGVMQRDGVARTIRDATQLALTWIMRRLRNSPIGLLGSTQASNHCWQVWADSPDAYHHADGRLTRGSVAAIEVQGFTFDALMAAAELVEAGLLRHNALLLRLVASSVRSAVLKNAWVNEKATGYFASGVECLGSTVRPLAVPTANMGLLLASRLLDGDEMRPFVESVVHRLTDSSGLWCQSGIRTLSDGTPRFRPFAYHNGAVWPWQNFVIARGMRRHGFDDVAAMVEDNMLRVCSSVQCAPEYVQGVDAAEPVMNDALVLVESPDGNGSTFLHHAMSPAQKYQGWTAFGLWPLTTTAGIEAVA